MNKNRNKIILDLAGGTGSWSFNVEKQTLQLPPNILPFRHYMQKV